VIYPHLLFTMSLNESSFSDELVGVLQLIRAANWSYRLAEGRITGLHRMLLKSMLRPFNRNFHFPVYQPPLFFLVILAHNIQYQLVQSCTIPITPPTNAKMPPVVELIKPAIYAPIHTKRSSPCPNDIVGSRNSYIKRVSFP
jgi:hypothetical protein